MTALTRRGFALGALSLGLVPTGIHAAAWVEVVGSAEIHGATDIDAARRRALADALLSAAFAGGAAVQGHSAMSMAQITSDVLIVRPVGRVLGYTVVAQHRSAGRWQVRIRAQVGQPVPGQCHDRRALVLTVYPPEIRVSPQAPAWAEALAHQIAAELLRETAERREVAKVILAHGLPGDDPARDTTDWRALTRGAGRVPEGGHGLHIAATIAPEGRALALHLRLRLDGPVQERMIQEHSARIRLSGPPQLGRSAVLLQRDRSRLAQSLGRGALPALRTLLQNASCQPVRARIIQDGNHLHVAAGHMHGLTRASLAFTIDRDQSIEMLEITELSERAARLAPLDPTRSISNFANRAVRFIDTGKGLS